MKQLIILLFFLLHTPVFSAFVPTAVADGVSGLTYYTYRGTGAYPNYTSLAYPIALSTGISPSINYNWGGGAVLDSGRAEQVMVHWVGYMQWPGSGSKTVTFYNSADDGFVLKVNGTTVINNWVEQGNAYYNSTGSITLTGGQTYSIDIWYYENGGGAAAMLYWNTGAGITIVPGTSYATTATYWAPAAPQYTSSITTQQQARVDSYRARSYADASIYIDQIGNNNTIIIDQAGRGTIKGVGQQDARIQGNYNDITIRQGVTSGLGSNEINLRVVGDSNTLKLNQARTTQDVAIGTNGHYLFTDIYGNTNTLTTQQTNGGGVGGHYMETTITGNTNNVTAKQTDNGNKIMFVTVNGTSNTVDAVQKDSGQHYLDLKLTGNNHSVSSVQQGATQNRATIELINGGGGAAIDMIQNGGSIYNITTTCVTAGGCAPITVRQ
jgi:hypothetical protein